MAKIIDTDRWGRTREFEIVDTFPQGYMVWDIGRENFPYKGYIPLCEPMTPNDYAINVNTLKALFVGNEETAETIADIAQEKTVERKRYLSLLKKLSEKGGEE